LSHDFGYDRRTPVDRYYIERFLSDHHHHPAGARTRGQGEYVHRPVRRGVIKKDVLDIDPGNSLATVIADLAAADSIPDAIYDCFILT
jgi:hypothetical protein